MYQAITKYAGKLAASMPLGSGGLRDDFLHDLRTLDENMRDLKRHDLHLNDFTCPDYYKVDGFFDWHYPETFSPYGIHDAKGMKDYDVECTDVNLIRAFITQIVSMSRFDDGNIDAWAEDGFIDRWLARLKVLDEE